MAKARAAATTAAARWAKRVERLERSGLSIRTFAARDRGSRRGRCVLEVEARAGTRSARRGSGRPARVRRADDDDPGGTRIRGAGFEVLLRSGRTVRVPSGFDAIELGRLVTVLEEARS